MYLLVYSLGFLPRCQMYLIKTGSKSSIPKLFGVVIYVLVFVLVNAAIAYFYHKTYGVQEHIDWLLTFVYMMLSVSSFYVFVVNDFNAVNFKGRTMALSFLTVYLAMTTLVMSLVFSVPTQLTWYAAGLLFIVSYLLGFYGINAWSKKHNETKQLMQHELLTDELTRLLNRRAFAQHAQKEEQFCSSSNSQLSVLLVDIDNFKSINDQYGHAAGDVILTQISQIFKRHVNDSGSIYRWGGEEFVVLLPVTGLFEAKQVANKLVRKVAEHTFNIKGLLKLKVTISVGVAQWNTSESVCKETLERADQALYKAKSAGKNRVFTAGSIDNIQANKKQEQIKQA